MGKIVMPKNSALLNEIEAVLKIYYEDGGWVSNDVYKSRLKAIIGDDQYQSSYTKKAQITSYFGFTVWQDIHNPQSLRRITESGKAMYEALQANDVSRVQEVLMEALENVKFGRDNYGCPDCDSDIEPPALFIRAILDLGYLTYREFAYLLWKLEDIGANYTDSLTEIKRFRTSGQVELGEDAQKYTDAKPIMILVRWGFLAEGDDSTGGKHIVINAQVMSRFEQRLKNLKIYNIDKDVVSDSPADIDEDGSEDNEKRFRQWLSHQTTVNGQICSASTVSNNCSALKKVCQLMEITEYPDLQSIFEIKDMDIFIDVKNIIKNHPDYDDVNRACNNRFLSTGLKWYEKYLNELSQVVTDNPSQEQEVTDYDSCPRLGGGTNILLYGVPGSGKSWTIEHEYCTEGTIVERLVFHPDYTNADFVGQILPIVDSEDKQVTYEFAPGPFTNILRAAYTHPQQKYVLVIEEINRGNAPAIFGDVFQLLDRCAEEKTVGGITYPVGTSEYGITNENVAKVVYGDATHKVRIPANLSILGTMNTSDQNVFTLDTAFQRRWRMRLIENNFFNVRKSLAQAEILDTGVTWRKFCETINTIIIGNKAKMASAEDKRLGVYFVHENDLKFDDRAKPKPPHTVFASEYNDLLKAEIMNGTPEDAARLAEVREALMQIRIFPEKVIKYLWDDAFKFNPEALFDTDTMDDLEKVIRTFVLNTGKDRFKIFRQAVRDSLYPQN